MSEPSRTYKSIGGGHHVRLAEIGESQVIHGVSTPGFTTFCGRDGYGHIVVGDLDDITCRSCTRAMRPIPEGAP